MNSSYVTARRFDRHFQERISSNEPLVEDYKTSVLFFFDDPALVGDHALTGSLTGRRAFWINHDYRVVYQDKGDTLVFLDIGTHPQVYRQRKRRTRGTERQSLSRSARGFPSPLPFFSRHQVAVRCYNETHEVSS